MLDAGLIPVHVMLNPANSISWAKWNFFGLKTLGSGCGMQQVLNQGGSVAPVDLQTLMVTADARMC
jgi:hypothetical protein